MIIKNARIKTMDNSIYYENGYIQTEGKKIKSVGLMKDVPKGENEIDVRGGYVIPGLVEAHSHIGIFGDSVGFESSDGNEETDPKTPHLRAIDAINPMDKCFEDARNSGVTTVVTGPGSANVLGGQMAAIKTIGKRIDEMIVKAPCSMKCAFGENPKTVHNGKNQSPITRMATAAMLRESLYSAKSYGEHKKTRSDKITYDLKCEALMQVLKKKIPLHAHAHRADDIFTAIRIAKEFDIELKIVHGTESHLIADELAKEKIDVMSGPALSERSKPELKNLTYKTPGILEKHGIRTAIITDHPVIPINHLLLCAQLAVKSGMTEEGALKAITCDAAAIIGIDDRIGKIKEGYDADFVVYDKSPMIFESKLLFTVINGVKIHNENNVIL